MFYCLLSLFCCGFVFIVLLWAGCLGWLIWLLLVVVGVEIFGLICWFISVTLIVGFGC